MDDMTPLQKRATFLHDDSGMSWDEADATALRELGIGEDALRELVGEAGVMVSGTGVAILSVEEVYAFARHCLVNAPADLLPGLTAGVAATAKTADGTRNGDTK